MSTQTWQMETMITSIHIDLTNHEDRNNFRPGALGVWQRNARVVNTNMNSPVASMRSAQYGMLLQLSSYQGFRHQT